MEKKRWYRWVIYVAVSVTTFVIPGYILLSFHHGWMLKQDTFLLTAVPGAQDLSGCSIPDKEKENRINIPLGLDEFLARLARREIDEVWRVVTVSDKRGSSCVRTCYYGERRGGLPFYAEETVTHPKPEGLYQVAGGTWSVEGNELRIAYGYDSKIPWILAVGVMGVGVAEMGTARWMFRRRT